MNQSRFVTLEFLRHGPPHNQLLSPLTQYLGLCGNHSAVTVWVPVEHAPFLAKLQALQYKDSETTWELQLAETADLMTRILGQVPGLIAELKDCCTGHNGGGFTQLEIVLSASELALLPFELANAPNGCPGAGQSLILQSQNPLSLTRRVRRVEPCHFEWPKRPKVLFLYTSFPQMPVPADAHLAALMEAVKPWVKLPDKPDSHDVAELYSPLLKVLPFASEDAIQKELAREQYTHIHILAHGDKYTQGVDTRYGLVLHGRNIDDGPDVVGESRLATLFRTVSAGPSMELSQPAVVTIASCEGAQGGTVFGPGSSVAHALHEAGIPLVIGSQFPLSFAGSLVMVETLYPGLLRGYDPRSLLHRLRRELKARVPRRHDWASIVAYAALPDDLHAQLCEVRHAQARLQIEAAFDDYDKWKNNHTQDQSLSEGYFQTTRDRLKEGTNQLHAVLQLDELPPDKKADIHGLVAATAKREAEIVRDEAVKKNTASASVDLLFPEERSLLEVACEHYDHAFQFDRRNVWAIVQELALLAVLWPLPRQSFPTELDRWRNKWLAARSLSNLDLEHAEPKCRIWAYGNLIELHLLASLAPANVAGLPPKDDCLLMASEYGEQLWKISVATAEVRRTMKSTVRQISRYAKWFQENAETAELAKQVVEAAKQRRLFP